MTTLQCRCKKLFEARIINDEIQLVCDDCLSFECDVEPVTNIAAIPIWTEIQREQAS